MSEPSKEPQDAVVDARLHDVIARFGARISTEQREQVRSRIERTITLAAKLRETPLTNADEPEIVFTPYRGES
jgi:hypothetical protein